MELKRILARDSRAANDKALQLYGPDVLVISSQRVDNQTELIVAIDTPESVPAAAPQVRRHHMLLRLAGGCQRAKRSSAPSGVLMVPLTTLSGTGLAGMETSVMRTVGLGPGRNRNGRILGAKKLGWIAS